MNIDTIQRCLEQIEPGLNPINILRLSEVEKMRIELDLKKVLYEKFAKGGEPTKELIDSLVDHLFRGTSLQSGRARVIRWNGVPSGCAKVYSHTERTL